MVIVLWQACLRYMMASPAVSRCMPINGLKLSFAFTFFQIRGECDILDTEHAELNHPDATCTVFVGLVACKE